MKQFKDSVPQAIQIKMKALAEAINLNSICNNKCEAYSEQRIDAIEGNYVSGWIPNQDGGWDVNQFIRSDEDSSYHLTEKQSEFVDEQMQECERQFLHDFGYDEFDFDDDAMMEQYYEYENGWLDDAAVFGVQMFVEENQIAFRVYVNYKDAPYYREKYAEDVKILALEFDEFLGMNNEASMEQLIL
jgi:hypothetical protein